MLPQRVRPPLLRPSALALCLLDLGCVSVSRRAPSPVVAPPVVVLSVPIDAPVVRAAPIVIPAAVDTTPPAARCTATVRAEVHLRPTSTPHTTGTLLPAGTLFDVLGVDAEVRRIVPSDEDQGVLTRVRVASTGQVGWTFVRYTEFADECPLLVDAHLFASTAASLDCASARRDDPITYAARGPRRNRAQLLSCASEHWHVIERADVDGDGGADELVQADPTCLHASADATVSAAAGAVIAFLRRPDGWLGSDVVQLRMGVSAATSNVEYADTLRAGGALYVRSHELREIGGWCVDLPSRVGFVATYTMLTRVDRCGVARVVATVHEPLAGGCVWSGLADGSVEVQCRRPARHATLRWDDARFALRADGPTMPYAPSDAPLCRYSYER